jgi:hypothetical protein
MTSLSGDGRFAAELDRARGRLDREARSRLEGLLSAL